jgi:hypothetical protein
MPRELLEMTIQTWFFDKGANGVKLFIGGSVTDCITGATRYHVVYFWMNA